MKAISRASAVILLTVLLSACAGVGITAPNEAPRATVVLSDYVGGLVTADVTINGETMPLIFDTGGGATVVTPEFAEQFGCAPWGRMVGHRMRGDAIEAQICGPEDIEVDGHASHDFVGVFDLSALLPPDLPPVGGILALSAFQGEVVTLDLASKQLILESAASLHARVGDRPGMPLRLQRELTGLALTPFVPVHSEPGPLWFLVDSGHLGPVYLAPHAREILAANGITRTTGDEIGIDLRLGDVELADLAVAQTDINYDGVIGPRVLEQMVITFDFQRHLFWAAPRQ